ncbi:MAG: hypothetical protein DDT36_01464 [Firmicutes bacterium]|nr:hypothetical protein [Bacillota bacterium]
MLLRIALRTVFFYLAVVIIMRIMGKREIGNISPFDLVISIMIAELAVLPIENTDKPLLQGVVPLIVLLCLEMLLSYAALKSETIRAVVNGRPSVVVVKGKIMEAEMRKLRYNINDLLMGLRNKGIVDVAEVEYAVLEPSGTLSVIAIAEKRPVTLSDLELSKEPEELPLTLVTDGRVHWDMVQKVGWDRDAFYQRLDAHGIPSSGNVLFAYLDAERNFKFQLQEPSGRKMENVAKT